MTGPASVRPLTPEFHGEVLRIAASLPEWFTPDGLAKVRADLPFQQGFVAWDAPERCVGFLLFHSLDAVGRISWMGVEPGRHRGGVGRALLAAAEERLAAAGVRALEVLTLGDSVDYPPYARTRAFYRAMGFADHRREFHDDPECPESLILRKALA